MKLKKVLPVLLIVAVAGGVYVKRDDLKGMLPGGSSASADAKPSTAPTQKGSTPPAAGCVKWAPPLKPSEKIGEPSYKLAQGRLKARQEQVGLAVTGITALSRSVSALSPSAVVVVGCGNNVVTTKQVGKVAGQAPDPAVTRYDLASVTKLMVGMDVVQLANAGKFGPKGLNAPVGDFLPAWKTGDKSKVTIKMLLNHTSGLPGEKDRGEYTNAIGDETVDVKIEQNVVNQALIRKPGEFKYSNLGYVVLYQVGSKVALEGKVNRDLKTNFFEPLGMTETAYQPGPGRACAPTTPYRGPALEPCVARDFLVRKVGVTGHAGIFSTANDMGRLAAMLASGGKLGDKIYLRPADIAAMGKVQAGESYGQGTWTNATGRWGNSMGKSAFGSYGDTGCAIAVDPVSGYWVVILTNSSPTNDAKDLLVREAIKKINDAAIGAAKSAK